MKLLLDTHVWLWAVGDDPKLGARGRRLLETPDNELWLSPVSIWETALLVEKRRYGIVGAFDSWVEAALEKLATKEAPLTNSVALMSRVVHVANHDPADRFLAATAEVFGLTLLTADKHLLAGRGFKHLACR